MIRATGRYRGKPVTAWMGELLAGDPRRKAARVLAAACRREPGLIPRLFALLREAPERASVVSALARVGPSIPGMREELFRALADRAAKVRLQAVVLLGKMGREVTGAAEALVRTLRDPEATVRGEAARCLGRVGRNVPDAVPALLRALRDPDAGVRFWASFALGRIVARGGEIAPKNSEAVDALAEALKHPSILVRQGAVRALRSLGPAARPALGALVAAVAHDELAEDAVATLALIGPDGAPHLAAALHDPRRQVRHTALRHLQAMSSLPDANADLVVRGAAAGLDDSDPFIRSQALAVLARYPGHSSPALPALAKVLNDPTPFLASQAHGLLQLLARTTPDAENLLRAAGPALGLPA
jgi:HEAT repeat protein